MDFDILREYFESYSNYLGKIIIDYKSGASSEEIIKQLNNFTDVLVDNLNEYDQFQIEDISEFNNIFFKIKKCHLINDEITSKDLFGIKFNTLTNNQSILYLMALENEDIELLKYFMNNEINLRANWTLPISIKEYCKKFNLTKSYNFIRRY